ncbi:MAG: FAD-binding protein, partial [Nitrospira sp.]|nr:FAD-binding protein [Nitrospira sp.]
MVTTYEFDVLVMGAGLAGLRAALAAHQTGATVAVITKVHPVRSHSNAAQGGINAALTDRGDKWEEHAFETVKGSDYLGDQDAVEILAQEAGQDILALEHMGVIFNRNEDGRLGTRRFGGQKRARTFFVSDFTGQALLHVLYEQAMKARLPVFEEWFVTSLVKDEHGQCGGVVAFEIRSGRVALFKAKAVIIAAGGLGRVFEPSTNALICTGDGIALAYRGGAPLMDMEMVQYHPTTLRGKGLLLSEAARGEGAYLLNAEGERFMEQYAPNMMELASRDVVSRAEQIEINEGRGINGCVLLDCRHLSKALIRERLSQIFEEAKSFANIDLTEEPIPVCPGMHYMMGGVKTDVEGRCWDPAGGWQG